MQKTLEIATQQNRTETIAWLREYPELIVRYVTTNASGSFGQLPDTGGGVTVFAGGAS